MSEKFIYQINQIKNIILNVNNISSTEQVQEILNIRKEVIDLLDQDNELKSHILTVFSNDVKLEKFRDSLLMEVGLFTEKRTTKIKTISDIHSNYSTGFEIFEQ